jgi:hypothetical protein
MLTAIKIFHRLSDWRKPVAEFQKMYHLRDRVVINPVPDIDMNGPEPSHDRHQLLAGIQCLMKYGGFQQKKNYNKVMANIMALSFCIWWMSIVRDCSVSFDSS